MMERASRRLIVDRTQTIGSENFEWTVRTRPFYDGSGSEPAHFVIEQIADDKFELQVPFRYRPGAGSDVEVTADALGTTDFASIPFYMSWFASRLGRHTPAALVHDQLVRPGMDTNERVAADYLFRDMMDDLGVPPVRSRVMWCAVALATRCCMRPWGLIGIIVWFACALAGTALLVIAIASASLWWALAAIVGPFPFAVFWGKQFWAGVIGGYALWAVAVPALAAVGGYYLVYWPIEQAVRIVRKVLRHRDVAIEDLSGPPAYKAA
jgi:hypothetical protein